jgi:hypothetical protein
VQSGGQRCNVTGVFCCSLGFGEATRAQAPYDWASWCAVVLGDCDAEPDERTPVQRRAVKSGAASTTSRGSAQSPPVVVVDPPECEYKGTAGSGDEAVRAKLDYERQCFRHAEMIVRNRLRLLQASVEGAMTAARRGEQGASQ